MNKYPVYIVSKGRWENPITAKQFIKDGVDFKILVEPQEYENYCGSIPEHFVQKLPFSNLGLGSYPARNEAWKDSIINGHLKHWVFDDNIRGLGRFYKGVKVKCNALKAIQVAECFSDRYNNLAITSFQYDYFITPNSTNISKAFFLNCHGYSAMLIKNDMPFRWRLKYNEDVDLCLQVLHNGLCTATINAFFCYKTSTVAKMKGGNQDELYKGNATEKKILKARSLEEIWPQYVQTKIRFNRPHHFVDWKKHFKHPLIRSKDFEPMPNDFLKLVQIEEIGNDHLRSIFKNDLK